MGANFGFMLAIVLIILIINGFFWFRRHGKSLKSARRAPTEENARVIRHNEIQRRFEREQEDALEYIEKRNKTLALYDQVRRRAAAAEMAAEKESRQSAETETDR